MILIAFISVLLSVFNVSESLVFDEEIFLVDNGNDYNIQFNGIFKYACGNYYNIVSGSIDDSFSYDYVIQFAVPGLYNYNDNQRIGNFMYAGSVTDPDKINCSYVANEIYCNETANLVSIPLIERMEAVYNFVQSFQPDRVNSLTTESCRPRNVKDLDTVLICHSSCESSKMTESFGQLKLILINDNGHCDKTMEDQEFRLLAVLRPKPRFDTLVPTLLYKTLYLTSKDRTGLPNSVNLLPWRLLKFGILKFIQKVGWQRVLVVSDDSEFSVDFEEELTDLLQKEKIVFTAVRCDIAVCTLRPLILKLRELRPSIVIANMENSDILTDLITSFGATWILRNIQDRYLYEIHKIPQNREVFSVTMNLPAKQDGFHFCYHDILNEFLPVLSTINDIYHTYNGKANKKSQFYRGFAKRMNEIRSSETASHEAIVFVKRILPKTQLISKIYVNASGAVVQHFTPPFKKVPEDAPFCLAYTNDYYNPCENELPMIFMFVILLFIISVCWLSCFFDKVTPLNRHNYHRHYD